MFTLTGTITDHAGTPRAGATVAFVPVPSVTPHGEAVAVGPGRSVLTDAQGRFSVTLVHSPGLTYILNVQSINFAQRFEVPEQDGTTVDLKDVVEVLVASPLSPVVRGPVGPSPYEMAVSGGFFEGTEEEWLASLAATSAEHGALTGLEADDHPQYLTTQRGDARYDPLGTAQVVAQAAVESLVVPTSPQDIGAQPAGDYLTPDALPEIDLSGYVESTDARLSDARPPTAHRHPWSDLDDVPVIPASPGDIGAAPAGDYATNPALTAEAQARQAADSALSDAIALRQTAEQVDARVQQVVGTAPAALDTLGEIAERLADDADAVSALTSAVAGKADAGHNHDGVYVKPADLPDVSDVVREGDPRLTDARTPTAHDHAISGVTGLQAALDGKQPSGSYAPATHDHDDRYYTVPEVNLALSSKAASSHTHDNRYYTESEVDTALAGKANTTHQHPVTDLTATGTADETTYLRGDGAWATPEGGEPTLLDQQIYSMWGSLPGRAITAVGADVPIGANIAIGSIFRLSIPAKINMVSCSVKVAATTAGATGRIAIYSWEWDGTCTLVQDQGTVAIDVATQQVYSNFAGSLLPAGVYVAVFIPSAAVTMRMLSVYDALLGFQGGQDFNAGSNRAFTFPQATLGSYPGSAPEVLTMGPSTNNNGIASTSRSWCTIRTTLA